MSKDYLLVIEVRPRAEKASARITDGFNIYLQGRVPFILLNELFQKAHGVRFSEELLQIGYDFGLTAPNR